MIRPVAHRDQDRGRARWAHSEHRGRLAQLRVVQLRERRLAERERLFQPGDELLLGGRGVHRRPLRRRDARDLAAEDVVAFVREVNLNRGEAHLRRRGPVVVLVRRHRLGGGDQVAREPLLHLAQRVGDGTGRGGGGGGGGGGRGGRGGRRLCGQRCRENGEGNHQDIGSGVHRQLPCEEAWILPRLTSFPPTHALFSPLLF